MSESDFYTVNHRYEAQDAPWEWPTWELRAHGSAAPALAPDPAAPDDPAGSRGPGCPLPRLDPLGPWCSARLTFADGARVDVLVTVSDDHITVEDVRADPPLTLAGLTDLARWIEGPLDDAFRAATGRPHRNRPAPRQPEGPVTTSVEPESGPRTGQRTGAQNGSQNGPQAGPYAAPLGGAAAEPVAGRASGGEPRGEPGTEPEPTGAGQGAATGGCVAPAAQGEAGSGEGATGEGTTGTVRGGGVLHGVEAGAGAGRLAEQAAEPSASTGPSDEPSAGKPSVPSTPPAAAAPSVTPATVPVPVSATSASAAPSESSTSPEPSEPESPEPSTSEPSGEELTGSESSASPDPSTPSGPSAAPPPSGRARSTVLARSRAGERRRVAADAYRRAQREGDDPVLAVMLATGRNRRRSLRLIAGARDEGLLTPRHNKR